MRQVASRLLALTAWTLSGCFLSHAPDRDPTVSDAGTDANRPDAARCDRGAPCDCRAVRALPAGTHWVGVAPDRVFFNPYLSPAHRVVLTRTVWVGTTEATAGCYQGCIESGACTEPELVPRLSEAPRWTFGERYWENPRWSDHPIAGLTSEQAREYCAWLGGRLPTSAEWEKLARGEDGRAVPWAARPPDPTSPPAPTDLEEHAYKPDGPAGSMEPMLLPVNSLPQGVGPYGHFHLIGNATEWVADSAATYSAGDQVDPLDDVPGADRVIRSNFEPAWARRTLEIFPVRQVPIGVRCAFDVEPEAMPR